MPILQGESVFLGFEVLKDTTRTTVPVKYIQKVNYFLSYFMSMLFLMWTWVLIVAFSDSKSAKFGFGLKN